jgi:DNA-binding SARP family transcriptional activator
MIEFRTLGTVDLRDGAGRSLRPALAQPKRVALLAYLALKRPRGFLRRDQLLAMFWPEADENRARNALNQALHFLRQNLGEDVVLTRGAEEVGLNREEVRCDVLALEENLEAGRTTEALSRYGGEFLAGYHLSGCSEFEAWLESERHRLRELVVQGALALAEDPAGGNRAEAVHWMRWTTALVPHDERVALGLIRLLSKTGDRSGARKVWETYRSRMQRDLELEPGPEITASVEKVLASDGLNAGATADQGHADSETGSESAHRQIPEHPLPTSSRSEEREVDSGSPVHTRMPSDELPGPPSRGPGGWKRKGLILGVALVLLILAVPTVLWVSEDGGGNAPPLDERLVLVAELENLSGDQSLDPVGRLAADWITSGLAETGLVGVVSSVASIRAGLALEEDSSGGGSEERADRLARGVGAGIAVSGSFSRVNGDSIVFSAQVVKTSSGRLLRSIEAGPTPVTDPLSGIEVLRQRTAGALATVLDSRLSSWASVASQPPSYEAYARFADGLDLYVAGDHRAAANLFGESVALDSGFTVPLIWTMLAYREMDAPPRHSDSILRKLEPLRNRLAPWDRAMMDFHRAELQGDLMGAHWAMGSVVELTPDSEWTLYLAGQALAVNRPNEALNLLRRFDPAQFGESNRRRYWQLLTHTLHWLGEYEEELSAAMRWRVQTPGAGLRQEMLALAGLGRIEEVARRVEEEWTSRPWTPSISDHVRAVAVELIVQGHPNEGENLLEALASSYRGSPPEIQDDLNARLKHGTALYLLGRETGAFSVFRELEEAGFEPGVVTGFLGLLAARRRDQAGIDRADQYYASRGGRAAPWATHWRARIAAVAGEEARAVEFLRQAFRMGWAYWWQQSQFDYQSLRGYPPFEEFMRPKG